MRSEDNYRIRFCGRCGMPLDLCFCGPEPVLPTIEWAEPPLGWLEPWATDWTMGFPIGPEATLNWEGF